MSPSSNEVVLVGADPLRCRFIIYDPVKGRNSTLFFKEQIDILRPFVADYIETFGGWSPST